MALTAILFSWRCPARPGGPLRQALKGRRGPVAFHELADLGRNPARIIPAALSFALTYPHRKVLCLWEPAWPERSDAELCEVARHEAAANLAQDETGIRVLCAYDASALRPAAIAQARCTHPLILDDDHRMVNSGYLGPASFPIGCHQPLAPPPPDAASLTYETELRPVRALAAAEATRAGLPAGRGSDLVLAVSELAANTSATPAVPERCMPGIHPGRCCARSTTTGSLPIRLPGTGASVPTRPPAMVSGWSTSYAIWSSCAPARKARAPPYVCISDVRPIGVLVPSQRKAPDASGRPDPPDVRPRWPTPDRPLWPFQTVRDPGRVGPDLAAHARSYGGAEAGCQASAGNDGGPGQLAGPP
jgi:hypothetical protein